MIYPPISKLLEKTDSRYTLVVAVAKRARQLADVAKIMVDQDSEQELDRYVSRAIYEIADDKVVYYRTKNGIK